MGQGEKNQSSSLTVLCSPLLSHAPFLTSPFSRRLSLSFPCLVLWGLIPFTDTYFCTPLLTWFWLLVEFLAVGGVLQVLPYTASCCFFLGDLVFVLPSTIWLIPPLSQVYTTHHRARACADLVKHLCYFVFLLPPQRSKPHIDPTAAEALKRSFFSHPYSSGNT